MFEDGTLSKNLKASFEQIAKDCNGMLTSGQVAVMRMVIAHINELDGKYVEKISLRMDIKCFFGTIKSVLKSDGVVEGGTGEMKKKEEAQNKEVVKKETASK